MHCRSSSSKANFNFLLLVISFFGICSWFNLGQESNLGPWDGYPKRYSLRVERLLAGQVMLIN